MREAVLTELARLSSDVLDVRAHFPNVEDTAIGWTDLGPVPFYVAHGRTMTVRFSHPLTADDIVRIRRVGQWVNETAIVRLMGILNSHQITDDARPIAKNRIGTDHVGIARGLRNVILKEGGHFKADKKEHQKLATKLADTYSVARPTDGEPYPLPIHQVVLPMIEGCRKYVADPAPLPPRSGKDARCGSAEP